MVLAWADWNLGKRWGSNLGDPAPWRKDELAVVPHRNGTKPGCEPHQEAEKVSEGCQPKKTGGWLITEQANAHHPTKKIPEPPGKHQEKEGYRGTMGEHHEEKTGNGAVGKQEAKRSDGP
jgi:hypothetical protein